MANIDVIALNYALPDGRRLLDDVSFSVGDGEHVALIGANGVGKRSFTSLQPLSVTEFEGGGESDQL